VRPLPGRAVRSTGDSDGGELSIPDGASATRSLAVELPANATAISIDVAYEVDHPLRQQVSVVLDPPSGSNLTLLAAGAQTGPGAYFDYASPPAASSGSTWGFVGSDNLADAVAGVLAYAAVTIHYSGGTQPFPATSRYESAVRELGDVTAFGTLHYAQRQTTTAKVQLRTCDTADTCVNTEWIDVADGETPAAPARRFAQYAVELTSNGDVPAALDWIEINYAARK
jgi:hypothetical protein